ncbi:acyl-CoA thioesterase [Mobilicoccus massiliensis]|uniref:acyl-CoA thioesterase n=1 Tax=Mobilicoccus massiliensis TaxID=1522310 RepID=UPI00058C1FDF|nr:thioesterase family protein [Mobilicoccus massiliensis]
MTDTSDDATRPYVLEIPLRWSDMDAYGHVNNAKFVTLLEEARVIALHEWFGDSGLLEGGIVVSSQTLDYTAQLSYRAEPVAVVVWCSHLGASSFTIAYEVRDPARVGDTSYCLAETTLVRFDAKAGHSRRLSETERAVFERHLGEPPALYSRRKQGR